MASKVLDENTEIGKAIIKRSIKNIIKQLLEGLKTKDIALKTAIGIGPGVGVIPAAVFLKNGIFYAGLEPAPRNIAIFRANLLAYLEKLKCSHKEIKELMGRINLQQGDAVDMDLRVFQDTGRPLVVMFFDSLSYLTLYAPSKTVAKDEDTLKESISSVVNKAHGFLEKGDVLACFWTLSLHMPRVMDAEVFYEIVKTKKFENTFFIQLSSDVAVKVIRSQIEGMCGMGIDCGDPAVEGWNKRLGEIKKQKKPVLFGVICIK